MSSTDAHAPTTLAGDSLEAGIARLEARAREAWGDVARRGRWTLWVRVSWSWPVSEATAWHHLARWANKLRASVPGVAILAGLHTDTDRRHAHLLVFVPRRWWDVTYPEGITPVGWCWEAWLGWRHGHVWVQRYSPGRSARGHGAAEYLARDVGTVERFGSAPEYRPRRAR